MGRKTGRRRHRRAYTDNNKENQTRWYNTDCCNFFFFKVWSGSYKDGCVFSSSFQLPFDWSREIQMERENGREEEEKRNTKKEKR